MHCFSNKEAYWAKGTLSSTFRFPDTSRRIGFYNVQISRGNEKE